MFYYEIPWFYRDFKSENLCFLILYPVHAVRILDLSLKMTSRPPKWITKHLYNSKGLPFRPEQVQYLYLAEAKFFSVLKMCYVAVNLAICSVKSTLVTEFQISNGRRSVSRIYRYGGFHKQSWRFFLFEQKKVGFYVFQQ